MAIDMIVEITENIIIAGTRENETTMLTAIIAFVNSHFSGLVAGVAAESSIISLIYGAVMNDMAFAIGMTIGISVLAACGIKFFATREPKCYKVDNVGVSI